MANLAYFAFPEPLQGRVFRIGNALLVMAMSGLLVHYGPRWGWWLAACVWAYFEALQNAVCRIATFDQAVMGGSMLCMTVIGAWPYQALLAASLAVLAAGWVTLPPARNRGF